MSCASFLPGTLTLLEQLRAQPVNACLQVLAVLQGTEGHTALSPLQKLMKATGTMGTAERL